MYKIIGADQKEYGPVTAEQLRMWIRDGRVNAQTLARSEAGGDWQPVGNFPELADAFGAPAAAPGTAPGMPPSPMGAAAAPFASTGSSRAAALSAVKGPAIALLIVGAMGVAFFLFGALSQFVGHSAPQPMPQGLPPEWQGLWQKVQSSQGPLDGLVDLFFAAMSGLVLFGAIKMMRLQSRGLATAACIIAMLPVVCFCCIPGLPFGIWGLVVLNKPEVKSQFDQPQ